MTKIDKEILLQVEEELSDIFLPYKLTDRIIEEVIANGSASRNTVMNMLLKNNGEVIRLTDKTRKDIFNNLKTKLTTKAE